MHDPAHIAILSSVTTDVDATDRALVDPLLRLSVTPRPPPLSTPVPQTRQSVCPSTVAEVGHVTDGADEDEEAAVQVKEEADEQTVSVKEEPVNSLFKVVDRRRSPRLAKKRQRQFSVQTPASKKAKH